MINEDDLKVIANLAKLEISPKNFSKLLDDMNNIVNFANKIDTVKLENNVFAGLDNLQNKLRPDEILNSFSQSEILQNCKTAQEGFFKISSKKIDGGE